MPINKTTSRKVSSSRSRKQESSEDALLDKDFLIIDDLNLDREWIKQPQLYFQYAENLAIAKSEFDQAKAEADLVSARLDAKIRSNPEKYKIEKISEKAISSTIEQNAEMRKANNKIIKAKYRVELYGGVVTALEHKKRALTMLVELSKMNYFSDPSNSASPENNEAIQSMRKSKARRKTSINKRGSKNS